jgi:hypothetical protein
MLLASCHSHSFVNNIGGELWAPYRAKLKKTLPDNYMELPSDSVLHLRDSVSQTIFVNHHECSEYATFL